MKQTENYGFEKPDIKEFFKLETWKNNMDKIDEAIKERETAQKVTDEEIKKIKNVQFTQADERKNIESKETLPVLFGKIAKWLADLKKVAFTGSYNDLENKPNIPAAVAVKGNAEKNYRTGNVNLTPNDIGALPIGGGTLTGQLQVGEKVKLYTSSEGGNIQIISPDDIGLRWELDAFKGDLRFICFNNDDTVKKICQLTKDGTLIANNATQSAAGLMSPKDKEKLDNLSIVNNNTTTEAGYALDARQANPNVDGSLAKQISTLNSGLANKYFIKIMKSDWSGIMGSLTPMFNINNDNITDLIAHNEQNDTYPGVRVSRASADYDGNNIPDTYLKKADAKNNVSSLSNTTTNYNNQTPVVQYFTVPDDGYYLVTGLVTFSSNANGFREVFITNTTSNYVMGRVRVPAVSGGAVTLQVTSGGTFEPGQTGTLSTYQNSGSNLNVQEWLSMVKIAPKL